MWVPERRAQSVVHETLVEMISGDRNDLTSFPNFLPLTEKSIDPKYGYTRKVLCYMIMYHSGRSIVENIRSYISAPMLSAFITHAKRSYRFQTINK